MAQSKARLVETPPSAERGVTATLSRSDIEETLKSADGPALLTLDIARRTGDEGDVEAHTLEVELEKLDLEEILRTATGDAIELRFDGTELDQALDSDVDAHGLRQKALILSVAVATAAGVAGQARAMPVVEGGGAATAAVAAPMSDVVSGGPAAAQAAGAQFASDVVSGGPAGAQAAETQFASDVVSGGPAGAQASESQLAAAMTGGAEWPREAAAASQEQTPLVSDVSGGGPAGAQAAESQFASDVVSGGPAGAQASESQLAAAMTGGAEWPREAAAASQEQTPLVSDVSGGGPAGAQAAESQFASDVVSGGPAGAQASESELTAAMTGGAEWPREAAAEAHRADPARQRRGRWRSRDCRVERRGSKRRRRDLDLVGRRRGCCGGSWADAPHHRSRYHCDSPAEAADARLAREKRQARALKRRALAVLRPRSPGATAEIRLLPLTPAATGRAFLCPQPRSASAVSVR